jgi:hypothetical protein
VPLAAHAWTLAGDRRIAAAGAKLGPPDLLLVIKKFNKDYARGIESAGDRQNADLKGTIEKQTQKVIAMFRANKAMGATIEQLGILAHLIGDANNPFHVTGGDASSHADFERYFENRMRKFPLVYYGAERNIRLGAFLDRTLERTAKLAPLVGEEYERGDSQTFDDHSTAFGVASLCYSHAVTDTANLFTYIWKQSGGFVGKN